MSLRRSHPKSHHGCDRCKRRRVKCDEQHPACKNCVRLGQNCNYQSSDGIKWAPASAGHALVPSFPGVINKHAQFGTENTLTALNARKSLYDIASAVPRLNISYEGVQLN
ncbi:hypothetical protein N7449_012281 [Penicillium cf. viridicatum]|uniref:Zn(2)-C6 fungal-type domain-containing protein n=1 Tax=Penicillium cf. viridicatum TaxID=2972119 RepID=A0A9W9IQI2_9EURO|nr:hypothetical protein N7449_012281 [Penicillium cf. viridicatum]